MSDEEPKTIPEELISCHLAGRYVDIVFKDGAIDTFKTHYRKSFHYGHKPPNGIYEVGGLDGEFVLLYLKDENPRNEYNIKIKDIKSLTKGKYLHPLHPRELIEGGKRRNKKTSKRRNKKTHKRRNKKTYKRRK